MFKGYDERRAYETRSSKKRTIRIVSANEMSKRKCRGRNHRGKTEVLRVVPSTGATEDKTRVRVGCLSEEKRGGQGGRLHRLHSQSRTGGRHSRHALFVRIFTMSKRV